MVRKVSPSLHSLPASRSLVPLLLLPCVRLLLAWWWAWGPGGGHEALYISDYLWNYCFFLAGESCVYFNAPAINVTVSGVLDDPLHRSWMPHTATSRHTFTSFMTLPWTSVYLKLRILTCYLLWWTGHEPVSFLFVLVYYLKKIVVRE